MSKTSWGSHAIAAEAGGYHYGLGEGVQSSRCPSYTQRRYRYSPWYPVEWEASYSYSGSGARWPRSSRTGSETAMRPQTMSGYIVVNSPRSGTQYRGVDREPWDLIEAHYYDRRLSQNLSRDFERIRS